MITETTSRKQVNVNTEDKMAIRFWVVFADPRRRKVRFGVKTEELLIWVGGVKAAEAIVGLASSAAGRVRVLSFVPLQLDPNFEEIVEKAQNVGVAALASSNLCFAPVSENASLNSHRFPSTGVELGISAALFCLLFESGSKKKLC
ncbi:hypothetical protein ACFX2J_016674 [Malus domestica]